MPYLLTILIWNVASAAALALLVALASCLTAFRERPALRHCLWLLVLVWLVTPPLIPLPVVPLEAVSSLEVQFARAGTGRPQRRVFDARSGLAGVDSRSSAPDQVPVRPETSRSELHRAVAAEQQPGSHEVSGLIARLEPMSVQPETTAIGFLLVPALFSASVTLVLIARGAAQMSGLRRLFLRAESGDEHLRSIVCRESGRLGVTRSVRVCVVSARVTPLLWVRPGKPVIVLPRSLVEELSDDQIGCIVCHELAHLVRRDHWANAFAFIVGSLFWWNPVVWWTRREMRITQEVCCDALVISRSGTGRRSYAQTLLHVVEFVARERSLLAQPVTGFGESRSITGRFEMISNQKVNHRLSNVARLLALSVLVAACCYPAFAGTVSGDRDSEAAGGNSNNASTNTDTKAVQSAEETPAGSTSSATATDVCAVRARSAQLIARPGVFYRLNRANQTDQFTVHERRIEQVPLVYQPAAPASSIRVPVFNVTCDPLLTDSMRFEAALARQLLNRLTGTIRGVVEDRLDATKSGEVWVDDIRWLPGSHYLEARIFTEKLTETSPEHIPVGVSIISFDENSNEFIERNFGNDGSASEIRGVVDKVDDAGVTVIWRADSEDGHTTVKQWYFPTAADRAEVFVTRTTERDASGRIILDLESRWIRVTHERSSGPAAQAGDPRHDTGILRHSF